MQLDDYTRHDAVGLAELIHTGQVSAEEVMDAARAAIEATNPRLNAVIRPLEPGAPPTSGALAGVPMVVKDLIADIAGEVTESGSALLKGWRAPEDTEIVRRLRGAGLRIVGKTNTPEFGLLGVTEPVLHGPTRNPWDPSRTSGGSSGGSGAAVAARMVPIGHGGDGGGSIRIPASHCGLFGLKPSRGRVTHAPGGDSWFGLAEQHALTRSVRDSAAVLDAIAGSAPGEPYACPTGPASWLAAIATPPRKLRIGFSTAALYGSSSHPDCVAAVHDAAALLTELGHDVEEAAPELDLAQLRRGYLVIVAVGIAHDVDRAETIAGRRAGNDIELPTRLMSAIGHKLRARELDDALVAMRHAGRVLGQFHETFDLFLTSTAARPPVQIGELAIRGTEAALVRVVTTLGARALLDRALDQAARDSLAATPNTQLFNQTGQPAMSVPLFWNAQGLPIGVQFAAPLGDEETLLRLAASLETARPWADRRPEVCA